MKEALVADLTKAFPGKVEDTLGRVEWAIENLKLNREHLFLIGREDQRREAQHYGHWRTATVDSAMDAIDALLSSLDKEALDLVHVASYNVAVLSKYGMSRPGHTFRISSTHFSSLQSQPGSSSATAPGEPARRSGSEEFGSEDSTEALVEDELPSTKSRSSKMEDAIRDRGYGPYSAIRQMIYEEMANGIESASGKSLREFVSDCVLAAKNRIPDESARYDWDRVRNTVIKILTEAQVILGIDGTPIPTGPRGRISPVGSFQPDWQTKADAELAIVAIDCLGDVCEYDYTLLAGALYHSRTPAAEDKVAAVLAELINQGRIREAREKGIAYLRPCSLPSDVKERFAVLKA